MNQDLKITPSDDYLLIEFTGKFDVESAKHSVNSMVDACTQANCKTVLFDIRSMTGDMSTMDRYKVGEYSSRVVERTFKIAMLAREDQVSHDKFFENIAVNRGLVLKVFTNIDEAVAWLKG